MAIHRRTFLAGSAGALSAAALDGVHLFGTQPRPDRPTFSSIRGNVGTMIGRGGTIGWLVTGGGTVVVDSQTPEMAAICLQFLDQTSKGQELKLVVNTHHHADHTAGNVSFAPEAREIVGHRNVPGLMARAAQGSPGPAPVPPGTTFTNEWDAKVGHEEIELRHYGPAHTGGDAVVTFTKANVAHVGDLVFNGRHPFLDREAGGSIAGWINVLRRVVSDHTPETEYIFGHAAPGLPIRGRQTEVTRMRDYLLALEAHVRRQIDAGTARAAIVKAPAPLEGFERYGPLNERLLSAVHDEIAGG